MDVILPEGRACSDVIAELRHEERFANLGRTDEQVPVGDVNALVSHALGNRHSGEAHLDEQRDMGMPLRYNYDKPEKPRISRVFGYLARFFILFQTEKSSREVIIS